MVQNSLTFSNILVNLHQKYDLEKFACDRKLFCMGNVEHLHKDFINKVIFVKLIARVWQAMTSSLSHCTF